MDVLSHFLIPFAGALALFGLWRRTPQDPAQLVRWRARVALAIVVGLAGAAPDLDGLTHWLRHSEGLYWLQHRGASHSIVGAPLSGLLMAGLVALVARWFPKRLGWLRWQAAYIPAAVVGGLTHLGLDSLTYGGIAPLWPMADARFTLGIYNWLVIWMIPPAGLIIVLFLLGRLSPRRVVQVTALLVVLVILWGGVRLGERPAVLPHEQVYPRALYQEWIVVTPDDEGKGWFVQIVRDGEPRGPQWHNQTRIDPGSEDAVARAKDTNSYRGLRMSTFGPVVTETRDLGDGSWEVNFTAVVPRLDAVNDPPWTPTRPHREWGLLVMHVHAQRTETLRNGF